MSLRKRFNELSKSQRNRRLKKQCEQSILETALCTKVSIDSSSSDDTPNINNSAVKNDNDHFSEVKKSF